MSTRVSYRKRHNYQRIVLVTDRVFTLAQEFLCLEDSMITVRVTAQFAAHRNLFGGGDAQSLSHNSHGEPMYVFL